MNKAFCRKKQSVSFLLAGCLILFNIFYFTSCGMDTFYEIDGPSRVNHEPYYDSIEEADRYFEFVAPSNKKKYDVGEEPPITFLGTDVYYKIYDSSSRLNSEYSSILQLANSETSSAQAPDRMIATYHFQPLRAAGQSSDQAVLVPDNGSDSTVKIRLLDYLPYDYAQVTIDGSNKGKPVRSIPNSPSFDFYSQSADLAPKSDDADSSITTSSGTTQPEAYYVSMFAVAIGQDTGYARLYSNVLYLGSVKIEK